MLLQRDPSFFAIPPGVLRLTRVAPNPAAPCDCVRYLLVGDATAGPITALWPDPGETAPAASVTADAPFRLKIVHFNDLHGQVTQFTPRGAQPVFARMAGYLRDLRARYAHHARCGVLAFSAGDDSVGSVFDALIGDCPAAFQMHAAYRLYSAAASTPARWATMTWTWGRGCWPRRCWPTPTSRCSRPTWPAVPGSPGLYFPGGALRGEGAARRRDRADDARADRAAPRLDAASGRSHRVWCRTCCPAWTAISDVRIVLSHLGYSLRASSATVLMAGDVELAEALPPGSIQVPSSAATPTTPQRAGPQPAQHRQRHPIAQAGKLGEFLGEVDITVGRTLRGGDQRAVAPHRANCPTDDAFEAAHMAAAGAGRCSRSLPKTWAKWPTIPT
jgi:5'-nucleotidase/UDP-sugar diphosphatase